MKDTMNGLLIKKILLILFWKLMDYNLLKKKEINNNLLFLRLKNLFRDYEEKKKKNIKKK
jgi:hypothetical protein